MSERTNRNAPRIVQVLDSGSSKWLLHAAGHIVGLDNHGCLWELRGTNESAVRAWHRLPIPPLPDDGGAR